MKLLVNGPESSARKLYEARPYYLSVGDKVTSRFYQDQSTVVRTLTRLEASPATGSGVRAWSDGGDTCPTCGHKSYSIEGVDGSWFEPVKKDQDA